MKTIYRGIDLGKMFSAILVVSIHAQLFYGKSIYSAYSFYISSVAVPFFFMVSGFLLERKIEDNNFENIKFVISNRIKNLFVPYLFWGILYFSLSIAIAVFLDGSTFFSALSLQFHKLLVSSPGGALWFCQSLILTYFVLYIVYSGDNLFRIFMIALGLFCVPYIFTMSIFDGTVVQNLWNGYLSVFLNTQNFVFRGFWIVLGMYLYKIDVLSRCSLKQSAILVAMSLCILLIVNEVLPPIFYWMLPFAIISYMIAWFTCFSSLDCNCDTKKFRDCSTVTFYSHFIFIYGIKIGLSVANIDYEKYHWLVFILTILCCGIFSVIIKKINSVRINKLFGI